ncbi:hypothetical protein [Sphingomonas sp. UBA978]|jgi:hypothetical protein|nr:hypothetical protein [Sphingomonas sp. UBA978]
MVFWRMPLRNLSPVQRLREHLEDALAEADAIEEALVAALICDALDMLDRQARPQPDQV